MFGPSALFAAPALWIPLHFNELGGGGGKDSGEGVSGASTQPSGPADGHIRHMSRDSQLKNELKLLGRGGASLMLCSSPPVFSKSVEVYLGG